MQYRIAPEPEDKKPSSFTVSVLNFFKEIFNIAIIVSVGCPIALYIINRMGLVSDMSIGYIFIPGYLLMLIIILMMRICFSFAQNILEDQKDEYK